MCTVTFVPRPTGYYLAMNRDEKLTRVAGLSPALKKIHGRTVISPSEPGGGTWIALNDIGSTVALINWYSVARRVKEKAVSRGKVVDAAGAATDSDTVSAVLERLPLDRINPFRLIGIFPAERDVTEWQWDLGRLVRRNHRWETGQWISSGFDEPTAERIRSQTFQKARRQFSSETLNWLRRLHRSHLPASGPFSICMHREDAATVSYTEIVVRSRKVAMRYHADSLCRARVFCRELMVDRNA